MKPIILLLFICAIALQAQENAKEIVQKSDQLMRANSSYSELTMKVIKPDWSREMQMKVWALEPDYALVLITAPARDKGTVTLKRKQEVWNYLPQVDRVIKIPPSMMLQSWMGSDFTNDDLVRQSSIVQDYEHTLQGKEEFNGYECYVIHMKPRPEAGVVWGKVLMWISVDGYIQLKAEYYDEYGDKVKMMVGKEVKTLGGRRIATHWEMIPLDEPDQKTVMIYQEIDFNIDIKPSFFSQQNMKRVR